MTPKTIRRAMLVIIWVVTLCSFSLSFAGIQSLGVASGYAPWLASLLPICLDGLVLAGSIVILDAEARGLSNRYGWLITLVGVSASVAANVASAMSSGITAQLVHALPPVVLALTLEAWLATMRGSVRQQNETEALEAIRLAEQQAMEAEKVAEEQAAAEREAAQQARAEQIARKKSAVSGEKVKALRDQGFTWREVAAALGVSEHAAQRALKEVITLEEPEWADDVA